LILQFEGKIIPLACDWKRKIDAGYRCTLHISMSELWKDETQSLVFENTTLVPSIIFNYTPVEGTDDQTQKDTITPIKISILVILIKSKLLPCNGVAYGFFLYV
jgi:hypothetical protein